MKSVLLTAALIMAMPANGTAQRKREQCHYNARHQLVCRMCWIERGKVRCGQPRISEGRTTD